MTVNIDQEREGKVLEVHVSGKLTKEDYERFTPEAEAGHRWVREESAR